MAATTRFAGRTAMVVGSAAVAQVAVFSQLPVAGVRVPLLLSVAVAGGLALGPARGAAVGFAAGLTFDLLLTTPMGLCAGVFAATGYVVGGFGSRPGRDRWWRLPAIGATTAVLAYGAVVLSGWLIAQRPAVPDRLVTVVLVVGALNGAVAPPAVRLLRWVGSDGPEPLAAAGTARGR